MRAAILLLLATTLFLPGTIAQADTFDTTITGGGYTIFFPNVGGPSNYYTNFTRVSELYASPLYVYVNGGPRTQGSLTFNYGSNAPSYNDLNVYIPSPTAPAISLVLYGPDLLGFVNLIGFYSFPGTYNLTDASGNPYTYVVTDETLATVPEPPSLMLCTTATLLLCSSFFHSRKEPASASPFTLCLAPAGRLIPRGNALTRTPSSSTIM